MPALERDLLSCGAISGMYVMQAKWISSSSSSVEVSSLKGRQSNKLLMFVYS